MTMNVVISKSAMQPVICSSVPTTLKVVGRDEYWLQDWIVADPKRLGLGQVVIKAKELRQHAGKGGRLDILAYDAALDTYYEVEVMLGECDADHGFRALDYWARERIRNPNARHVAVIVAEDLSGRYRTVIETLAQQLPLIAIEIRTLLVHADPPVATTFPVIFAQPDDFVLRPADEPVTEDKLAAPNDEASWQAAKPEFAKFAREMHKLCSEKIGPTTIDFSAKSYVALKKGKRAWLPMWPRANGAYVYIAGGHGGAVDQPSDFFATIKEELAPLGIEPSWSFKYNAGANPIAFPITFQHANHSKMVEILEQAYSLA
jgi:hypothetical protein